MPWDFFLGHAAHRLIAYIHGVNNPESRVFYNNDPLARILTDSRVGDASLLLPGDSNLRPDITDVTRRSVFEVKPWNDKGLQEGRQEVQIYLAALNRAVPALKRFSPGTNYRGEILVRFAQGQYVWRLEWQTTEPGVVQYRWTRSQERFASESAAYAAGQWVELTEAELKQYGGWVGQAVDGMVSRREHLAASSRVIGIAIDVIGNAAMGVFSSVILGQVGSRPTTRPSAGSVPPQVGAQVIPFPSRAPPTLPPARLPAASGR